MSQSEDSFQWVQNKELTVKKIVDQYLMDKSAVFLVGSGISIDPPSNLPSGYIFTRELLKKIIPAEYLEKVLSLTNPDRPNKKNYGDFLRFEQILSYLIEYKLDPDLDVLKGIGLCEKPNINHLELANLIISKNKHVLFTTNYDNLIEYALLKLGVNKEEIRPIIYQEEWDENEKNDLSYSVYKIHGSYRNMSTEKDTRDTMQATIKQLMKGKENSFSLESWKKEDFQRHIEKNPIIVVGYSGLDDFDIIPELLQMYSNQKLIWINHVNDLSVDEAKIEVLKNGRSTDQSRLETNLLQLIKEKKRSPSDILIISVNTGQFLTYLRQNLDGNNEKFKVTETEISKQYDFNSLNDKPEEAKWWLLANLFKDRELMDESYDIFLKTLEMSKKHELDRNRVFYLDSLGGILLEKGNYDEALEYYQKAIESADRLGIKEGKSWAYNDIALIQANRGFLEKAISYYSKALEIDKKLGNKDNISTRYNNMGNLYRELGKLDDAMECYNKSLEIARQEGLIEKIESFHNNVGLVLVEKGEYEDALSHFQESLEISEKNGHIYGKIQALNNLGMLNHKIKEYSKAKQNFNESIKLAELIGNKESLIAPLMNLGKVLEEQSEFDEASNNYVKALRVSEELNNLGKRGLILYTLGELLLKQNKISESLKYFEQSLVICKKLNDKLGTASCLSYIGMVYQSENDIEKALKMYEESLKIHTELKNEKGQTEVLFLLGQSVLMQGDIIKAKQYLNQSLHIAEKLDYRELEEQIKNFITLLDKQVSQFYQQ